MSDERLLRQRKRAAETLHHLSQYAATAADRIERTDNPGDHALAHNLLALAADAAPLLAIVDAADFERNTAS